MPVITDWRLIFLRYLECVLEQESHDYLSESGFDKFELAEIYDAYAAFVREKTVYG